MNIESIRSFFDLNKTPCFQEINESVSEDLNIDELFGKIDYTCSSIGQQYLYNLLRHMPESSPIERNENWIKQYAQNESLQKKVEKLLTKLNHQDAYSICSLIYREHYILTRTKITIFYILRFLPLLFVSLYILSLNNFILGCCFLTFIINLIIHFKYKEKAFAYSWSIPQLNKLLTVFEKLNKLPEVRCLNSKISDISSQIKEIKKSSALFRFNVKLESDITSLVWLVSEIIRIFFLFEPINLNKIFVEIKEKHSTLSEIYNFFGMIDTLQSIYKLRKNNPLLSIPTFSEKNIIEATDIFHPLIPECISNSFIINDKNLLILGSNMSGKTSFIRTVGLNVLTAQTINSCFAKKLILNKQKIYTAITTKDDILEGKSYYLSEVLHLKYIIENTGIGNNLILLDELFKGTNTIERIAGANAVLKYLSNNKRNKIIVATHDYELVKLGKASFTPSFFTEKITDNKLIFDYKIRYKSDYKSNAIKILDLYNYPSTIINDALNTVEMLKFNNNANQY